MGRYTKIVGFDTVCFSHILVFLFAMKMGKLFTFDYLGEFMEEKKKQLMSKAEKFKNRSDIFPHKLEI
jgi:hypothetical protein